MMKIGTILPGKPPGYETARRGFDELADAAVSRGDMGAAYWWWRKAAETAAGPRRHAQFTDAADCCLRMWALTKGHLRP